MRPTIINAHLGEDENQLLLFLSFSYLQRFANKECTTQASFADLLSKKGYDVAEYRSASTFSGSHPDKDGGYAFLIDEDSCQSEEQLLKDVQQIIFNEQN